MRKLRCISSSEVFGGFAVQETGTRNGAFGAEKFGFEGLEAVHWNLTAPRLYEYAIADREAELAYGGALAAETGVHTGRSPKDKFIVKDAMTERTVWWDNNGSITPEQFGRLHQDF
ncbi:MAG: phosphoenolpyruvate carboxykinase (ATP), partial [Alphaproteobacteria bacterium]